MVVGLGQREESPAAFWETTGRSQSGWTQLSAPGVLLAQPSMEEGS